MRAIILAAGLGQRLHPVTGSIPKPLVSIGGKTLIDHVIDALVESGIEDIVVIGGYRFSQLMEHLQASPHADNITILENEQYHLGNIYSLDCARDCLQGDILLTNADHLYPVGLIKRFLESKQPGISIACDFDRTLGRDDMKIRIERIKINSVEGSVSDLWAIGKDLTSFDGGYIGMTIIRKSAIGGYGEALTRLVKSGHDHASVEDVLGSIVGSSNSLSIVDLSGFGWMEIDTQDDLDLARKYMSQGSWKEFWN